MHPGSQSGIHCVVKIFIQDPGHKTLARIILIYPRRKHGKRAQIDTVAILQHIKAVVAYSDPQYIADTGQIARSSPHPGNIVISPLDIHIMEAHQLLHNDIRPGASVKNIPNNMEIINGKILDQPAERCYKFIRNTGVYDRMDNLIVIKLFIFIISIHMKQFINGICIFLRHLFANLGTGILGCHLPANLYQPVNGDTLPVLRISALLHHPGQMALRIIDQVCQLQLLLLRDHISKSFLDLLPDNAGGRPKQMNKGFIFSMKIAEKILRSLRQTANCHQIYDFPCRFLHRRKFPRQKLQICHVSHNTFPRTSIV